MEVVYPFRDLLHIPLDLRWCQLVPVSLNDSRQIVLHTWQSHVEFKSLACVRYLVVFSENFFAAEKFDFDNVFVGELFQD
jgi:hypothetical protein